MGRQWAALATTQPCFVILWTLISQLSVCLKEPPQSKCFPLGFSQNNRLKEQRKANYFPANRHVELQEGGRYNHMEILHKARMNLFGSSLSLSFLCVCVCVCQTLNCLLTLGGLQDQRLIFSNVSLLIVDLFISLSPSLSLLVLPPLSLSSLSPSPKNNGMFFPLLVCFLSLQTLSRLSH